MKSTPEFQHKDISMQNLDILNAHKDDSLKNTRNQSLIDEVMDEESDKNESVQAPSVLSGRPPADPEGRKLFWKKFKWKPPKPPKIPSHQSHLDQLGGLFGSAKQKRAQIQRQRARAKARAKPKPRIPRKPKFYKPIKPFKMGKWRPRTTLKPPKMSLRRYSPDYCPCKKKQKGAKRSRTSVTTENCTCGVTQPKNALFEDNGPFPDEYFESKAGEQWYMAQATVFRQYVRAKEREQKKYLKQAKTEFVQKYQERQIEALAKHYADMHNISRQLTVKKGRLFRKIMRVFKLLTKEAGKETVGSVMSACKLSISKAMVKYSKKYPKFLREIQREIENWKAFILEKHHIYFEEHEEKVQAYYDALEREKNENLAMEDAKKEAQDQNERENQNGPEGSNEGKDKAP